MGATEDVDADDADDCVKTQLGAIRTETATTSKLLKTLFDDLIR